MMQVVFREQARTDMRNVMAWFRDQGDGSEMRFELAVDAELLIRKRSVEDRHDLWIR